MNINLKKLSESDGHDVYEMIKEIGEGENGFINNFPLSGFEDFRNSLPRYVEISQGINLPEGYVPQTIYWLNVNESPVAYGKLRHRLNEKLLLHGGHVGFTVRPTERGKGYGKMILAEIKKEARNMGIDRLLLTCNETNTRSRKVIESNNGKLEDIKDGSCSYWITL